MKIKNTELKIIKADITKLDVDAIVNAANNRLIMGGGVAGAIRKKGGKIIEDEAIRKGPINIGEAVETGAGSLKAKYIIHAATMGMDFKTDELKIRQSCANSLKLAEQLEIKSIAFPALGCGVGGFSLVAAAKIMAQEIFKHLRENKSNLSEVIFCLYNDQAYQAFQKNVTSYLEYIQNKLSNGPFTTVDAIIELVEGIILIDRSNPPFGWALPGGFVDYGESLEEAVRRETKEETGMDLTQIEQFHTYSDPNRDPRFHTIGTIFIAKAKGKPKAGDDAKGLKIVEYQNLMNFDYAFDHKKIIEDYLKYKKQQNK
jgi:O-acetyl-ADP-ribose deacetylase (regulator of RNase III)/ADP-ribose pyrophosphatase YjhB (NUDIX family)